MIIVSPPSPASSLVRESSSAGEGGEARSAYGPHPPLSPFRFQGSRRLTAAQSHIHATGGGGSFLTCPSPPKQSYDMADNKEFTPLGCRIDNGRCFSSLEWNAQTLVITATFRDGSVYEFYGFDDFGANAWLDRVDPGCYFNDFIFPGNYKRIRPPN